MEYQTAQKTNEDFQVGIMKFKETNFDLFYSNLRKKIKLMEYMSSHTIDHISLQNGKLRRNHDGMESQMKSAVDQYSQRVTEIGKKQKKSVPINTFDMERRISRFGPRIEQLGAKLKQLKYCRVKGAFRDFKKDPIMIITMGIDANAKSGVTASKDVTCDAPCFYTGSSSLNDMRADGSMLMGIRQKMCPYQKNIHLTMENTISNGFDVAMDTRLDSEVTAGYYTWAGFDFMRKPVPKTQTALASAFISNCGASSGRDAIIRDLIKFGVTVDGYGRCFPDAPPLKENKPSRMAKYKFHLAFENSKTPDYVTEKYFESIETGTLGVYLGAPNIRMYEPQENAILRVQDFPNTEALAKEMLRLANNTNDYNKFFEWKERGPQDSFKALVDISAVHSYCRVCIHLADRYMNDYGQFPTHPTDLLVRERNTFWYKPVHVDEYTLKGLRSAIAEAFKDHVPVWANQRPGYVRGGLKIYRITPPAKNMREGLVGWAYDSDEKIGKLKPGMRLEVIFI
jgi:glycoprotein 3-alpha-L-fucosyltransferase